MSGSERRKGTDGEVAAIYTAAGLAVRGLEGAGDHLVACGADGRLVLHSEAKRHETARPWAWWKQASDEAPDGTLPVLAFRRNRSRWLAQLDLADLAALAQLAAWALDNGAQLSGPALGAWRTLDRGPRVAAGDADRQNP
jgi:hypothetical protein